MKTPSDCKENRLAEFQEIAEILKNDAPASIHLCNAYPALSKFKNAIDDPLTKKQAFYGAGVVFVASGVSFSETTGHLSTCLKSSSASNAETSLVKVVNEHRKMCLNFREEMRFAGMFYNEKKEKFHLIATLPSHDFFFKWVPHLKPEDRGIVGKALKIYEAERLSPGKDHMITAKIMRCMVVSLMDEEDRAQAVKQYEKFHKKSLDKKFQAACKIIDALRDAGEADKILSSVASPLCATESPSLPNGSTTPKLGSDFSAGAKATKPSDDPNQEREAVVLRRNLVLLVEDGSISKEMGQKYFKHWKSGDELPKNIEEREILDSVRQQLVLLDATPAPAPVPQ